MPFDLWRNRRNASLGTTDCWVDGVLKSEAGGTGVGYAVLTQSTLVTESTGAGTYTGAIVLPAGATLIDIIVTGVAVWNTATSATGKVGDATDDDGYFTGIDLKATDLLAGEEISIAGGTGAAGGKAGADISGSQVNRRFSAAARTINLIVTSVGATGTLGRTRMTCVYSVSSDLTATKV